VNDPWPDRISVVGTPVSATSIEQVLDLLEHRPDDKATVIAFCNVHSVMTARRDPSVAAALAGADVAAPDGMPIVWGLRAMGREAQRRVDGPTFMQEALRAGIARGWSHYFYGSTEDTLGELMKAVRQTVPGVVIVGSCAPPFRPPTDEDIHDAARRIRDANPDLVWVGLGMPKQELWMQRVRPHVPGVGLLGVGAAFEFIAQSAPRAPRWMQATGLEWVHRLIHEPRRLWRRYLFNNPAYLALLARDLTIQSTRRRADRT